MIQLIIAWCFYFFFHSFMASHWFKKNIIDNRKLYVLIAILSLIPVLYFSNTSGSKLWTFTPPLFYLSIVMKALALTGFIYSFRYYDVKAFLGLKSQDHKAFVISPLHHLVRHPWYFYSLLFIWSNEMNIYQLTSALLITLYLIIGSRIEENKLVIKIGQEYKDYMEKVPGLIPLPWKYLPLND